MPDSSAKPLWLRILDRATFTRYPRVRTLAGCLSMAVIWCCGFAGFGMAVGRIAARDVYSSKALAVMFVASIYALTIAAMQTLRRDDRVFWLTDRSEPQPAWRIFELVVLGVWGMKTGLVGAFLVAYPLVPVPTRAYILAAYACSATALQLFIAVPRAWRGRNAVRQAQQVLSVLDCPPVEMIPSVPAEQPCQVTVVYGQTGAAPCLILTFTPPASRIEVDRINGQLSRFGRPEWYGRSICWTTLSVTWHDTEGRDAALADILSALRSIKVRVALNERAVVPIGAEMIPLQGRLTTSTRGG